MIKAKPFVKWAGGKRQILEYETEQAQKEDMRKDIKRD